MVVEVVKFVRFMMKQKCAEPFKRYRPAENDAADWTESWIMQTNIEGETTLLY